MDDLDSEARRRALIARLVELRRANGLTQAAVAELMHVGQSVIAEIESGRTDVRLSTVDRYAHAVSVGKVRLAETVAAYGPAVDDTDFWIAPTLDDLIADQGTGPILDPRLLALEDVSESDWDAFFSAMGIVG